MRSAPSIQRLYIFDLDGTLVDSIQGIAQALNDALEAMHFPTHSLAVVRTFIGNGARKLVERAAPQGASSSILDQLQTSFGHFYAEHWAAGTFAYEGIHQLLERLEQSNCLLAVFSNKPHLFTTQIVNYLFPHSRFSSVVGHQASIPHKPDPFGALWIAQQAQIDPKHCVFIGDSTMDIDVAHAAGMQSIAVTWGYHDADHLQHAHCIASSVNELETILLNPL
jgi:phosphoglycolate phosphatase